MRSYCTKAKRLRKKASEIPTGIIMLQLHSMHSNAFTGQPIGFGFSFLQQGWNDILQRNEPLPKVSNTHMWGNVFYAVVQFRQHWYKALAIYRQGWRVQLLQRQRECVICFPQTNPPSSGSVIKILSFICGAIAARNVSISIWSQAKRKENLWDRLQRLYFSK